MQWCRDLNHDGDGDPKKKNVNELKKNGVATNSFSGKTMENPKRNDKGGLQKSDRRSGSRLRVGKVLAPPQRPSWDGTF